MLFRTICIPLKDVFTYVSKDHWVSQHLRLGYSAKQRNWRTGRPLSEVRCSAIIAGIPVRLRHLLENEFWAHDAEIWY